MRLRQEANGKYYHCRRGGLGGNGGSMSIEGAGAYWESLGEVSGDRGGYWGLMRFLVDKSASSGSAANN